jgi:rubrerythrin
MRRTKDPHALLLETENIDVQALFNAYNSLYFDDKLKGMQVRWSNKMTLCAGQFQWGKKDLKHGAEIVLSEPLLKMRPKSDTLNTLMHEMIHAYLHVTDQRDTSDHGTLFTHWMKLLNEAERATISIYHTFHDEVDHYRQHVWACDKCGNIVKRAMNRDPNAPCGPQDVNFYAHKQICDGSYVKIHAPEKSLLRKKDKKKSPIAGKTNQKTIDSFLVKDETKTECPVCGKSITTDVSLHVNSCLDTTQDLSRKRKLDEIIDLTSDDEIEEITLEKKKQKM